MNRFKLVVLAIAVTSAFWLSLGAWWSLRHPMHDHAAIVASNTGSPRQTDRITPQIPAGGHLLIPVAGVAADELVDTFTQARANGERRHDAIDIPAPRGTPVIAAAPGIVEKLFTSIDGGKTIYVRSPDRTRTYYYAHLQSYAPGLSEGQVIGVGDQLGGVGSTGNASRNTPHLHFEVMATTPDRKWFEEERSLNPYPLLKGR